MGLRAGSQDSWHRCQAAACQVEAQPPSSQVEAARGIVVMGPGDSVREARFHHTCPHHPGARAKGRVVDGGTYIGSPLGGKTPCHA